MAYTIGQRWISNTESTLGLGIITEIKSRQVTLFFPAANEERIYAMNNAPLSRIMYQIGDEVTTDTERQLTITNVFDQNGIIIYTGIDPNGEEVCITEASLSCFIKLCTPEKRLFSGLLDKLNAFKLRIETLQHTSRLQQSPARGLLGSRTSHLPHQVYIAHEVAKRHAPRVLLADEVGLGKTIEALMILHYQLHTNRAQRVLIVVPDTLIHQWLVEMMRRFNLHFSIIDAQRYDAPLDDGLDEEDEWLSHPSDANIFETEPLVLCSLDFLMSHEQARMHALETPWDLLIIDEAHHLHWSEEESSLEYSYIEQLASQTKGLLLLTATPEQVGIASHFARLRLLDPARFHDLALFKEEEARYQEINQWVEQLLDHPDDGLTKELPHALTSDLATLFGAPLPERIDETIKNLLDRHGTGRVLFRNTRAAIQGFPERALHAYALSCPELYASTSAEGLSMLTPETAHQNQVWLSHDPRVSWLIEKISSLLPKKVLVICAKAQTAITLEQHLKLKAGIRSIAFHERLSILERDRAAAYFSETENGALVLVCSEIGSEGRNFQFAHHLVLFDLPLNPDLVEQRIGRLDRIGQKNTINIHVPYIKNTAQEVLFRWYHEGINLFEKSAGIGFSLFEAFKDRLYELLMCAPESKEMAGLATLISDTSAYTAELNHALERGRCRLLEMNSCHLPAAEALIQEIEAEENCLELADYMARVFQEYGIEHEYHSDDSEILRPTEHMKSSHFPGLKDDAVTITYSRPKALIREDMEFLSWEHPMVYESMDMILESELGNATITTIAIKSIPQGTLFLEAFYTIHCAAPKELQLDRFLPMTPIRVLMDISGKDLSNVLSYTKLNELCEPVKRHLGYPIIKQVQKDIETILEHCQKAAEKQISELVEKAMSDMKSHISYEINRLLALKKRNPNIREEELRFLEQHMINSEAAMQNAQHTLQALRLVINHIQNPK